MALKHCNKCGKTKDTTQFSKKTKSKDGLQASCKACNKKDNDLFRNELNPNYASNWVNINRDKWNEYQYKVQNNDYWTIYLLIAPDQMVYVGQCHSKFEKRLSIHKSHYKCRNNRKFKIPLLWYSFDKHGIENHIPVLIDKAYSLKEALEKENYFISIFQQQNKSLNKNKNNVHN